MSVTQFSIAKYTPKTYFVSVKLGSQTLCKICFLKCLYLVLKMKLWIETFSETAAKLLSTGMENKYQMDQNISGLYLKISGIEFLKTR